MAQLLPSWPIGAKLFNQFRPKYHTQSKTWSNTVGIWKIASTYNNIWIESNEKKNNMQTAAKNFVKLQSMH